MKHITEPNIYTLITWGIRENCSTNLVVQLSFVSLVFLRPHPHKKSHDVAKKIEVDIKAKI